MTSAAIVQKLWNYCNVLRDDGMSYGDYPSTSLRAGSEQLTYLLFLKTADERRSPPYHQPSAVKTTRRRRYQALQISPWTFDSRGNDTTPTSLWRPLFSAVSPKRSLTLTANERFSLPSTSSYPKQ
jgi:hypothetical protein